MKSNWNIIVGLLFGVIALICVILSMFQVGNNIFLFIALICNCISLVLILLINRKGK